MHRAFTSLASFSRPVEQAVCWCVCCAVRCSLYKCKICLDIRTERCQRDLSVPSSQCRRRHNILYTHIIHFVYPRSASDSTEPLPLLLQRQNQHHTHTHTYSLWSYSFFHRLSFIFIKTIFFFFHFCQFSTSYSAVVDADPRTGKFLQFSHKMWTH